MGTVTFQKVDVDGIKVFYREAGPKGAPTILLLHGFPTAGHMFRDLIPQLADSFRLVAPDLPGVWAVGYARAERLQLHVREYRERHRSLHRGDRPPTVLDVRFRLRSPR